MKRTCSKKRSEQLDETAFALQKSAWSLIFDYKNNLNQLYENNKAAFFIIISTPITIKNKTQKSITKSIDACYDHELLKSHINTLKQLIEIQKEMIIRVERGESPIPVKTKKRLTTSQELDDVIDAVCREDGNTAEDSEMSDDYESGDESCSDSGSEETLYSDEE